MVRSLASRPLGIAIALALLATLGTAWPAAAAQLADASAVVVNDSSVETSTGNQVSCSLTSNDVGVGSLSLNDLVGVVNPSAACSGLSSTSSASSVSLFAGASNAIEIRNLFSRCAAGGASSTVDEVTNPGGDAVTTIGSESRTLSFLDGAVTLIFNEQVQDEAGNLVQNAVHLIVNLGSLHLDIVVGQSLCPLIPPPAMPEVSTVVLMPLAAAGLFFAALTRQRRRVRLDG